MKTLTTTFCFLFLINCLLSGQTGEMENWPQWRGPTATGFIPSGNPPIRWSESTNIKWKSDIPGIGHATPIVCGDQIILLSAIQTEQKIEPEKPAEGQEGADWMNPTSSDFVHRFEVISVDKSNGEIRWRTAVREQVPFSHTHEYGSWASNSPVTDGERIYAYFGSYGLYSLSMEGKVLWDLDPGRMEKAMSFGEGSSPVLYKDKLFLQRDHEGQSTLLAIDKNRGEILWKVNRDEPSSWSTPLVIEYNGSPQLITSATNKIRSYNIENGTVIWECSGLTRNVISNPVYADGMIYLMSGYRGNALLAIDLSGAEGNITGSGAIVWKYEQNTPYTPSPLYMDGKLYFLKANNGYLTCLEAKDGTEHYTGQKLEGIANIFTSPTGVNDRIYIAGTNGTTCVVKPGESFELLSQNTLDDTFYASPVPVGNCLLLRGVHSLYCISE